MGVTGTYSGGGGGGLCGDMALLRLCGAGGGHVVAGGACEVGLVGHCIVAQLLTWWLSRGPMVQWGCRT